MLLHHRLVHEIRQHQLREAQQQQLLQLRQQQHEQAQENERRWLQSLRMEQIAPLFFAANRGTPAMLASPSSNAARSALSAAPSTLWGSLMQPTFVDQPNIMALGGVQFADQSLPYFRASPLSPAADAQLMLPALNGHLQGVVSSPPLAGPPSLHTGSATDASSWVADTNSPDSQDPRTDTPPRTVKKIHSVKHRCEACGTDFPSSDALTAHGPLCPESAFRCEHCSKGFKRKASLVRHIRIHTGERPFACNLCPLAFKQRGTLQSHMRIHTGENPFVCPYCNKGFKQRGNMNAHTRVHTNERPYSWVVHQDVQAARVVVNA